jgi:hypothetical protein
VIGVMGLAFIACVLALGCVLVANAGSARAATEFGEEGEHSGQFKSPGSVAVDQASGDVYVNDRGSNVRIDKFTGSGGFQLAWGWGVNEENPAEELQTCTTFCEHGIPGSGMGTFASFGPLGVAVDNDPHSSSRGDVYVVDWENARVQKFSPKGEFVLMFGWKVNETAKSEGRAAEENICPAPAHPLDKCKAGEFREGGPANNGQFEWWFQGSFIGVGPGGDVYVGDQGRVQVFEPSGAWKESISLAGLSPEEGAVHALAVDSSGDVFVQVGQNFGGVGAVPGVHEFNPAGTEIGSFDTKSEEVKAIAVAATDDVYVADSQGGYHFLKFDATGTELASFGANIVGGSEGIAFADMLGQLYVAGETIEAKEPRVFVLSQPPPGPLIARGSEIGTPHLHGEITFEATINPEGHATTYRFEYLTEQQFSEDGGTFGAGTASTTATVLSGSEFEEEHAEAKLPEKTLVPGETYRWRVIASNECEAGKTCTSDGAVQTLEETPPALVDGPSATDVTATSVTLAARIDPQGASTSYRLEYGPSLAYGRAFEGNVGAGTAFVAAGPYHVQGLAPGTTYHYRVVTVNNCYPGKPSEICTQEGADHTFTTSLLPTSGSTLPDQRAWELVSPASTGEAVLQLEAKGMQAAGDGGALTYRVTGTMGENVESHNGIFTGSQILSSRGMGGWRTEDIEPSQGPPSEEESANSLVGGEGIYQLFSPDLGSAALSRPVFSYLSAEGLKGTPYLRDNVARSYVPLFTSKNVWPGTSILEEEKKKPGSLGGPQPLVAILGGTPDLRHFVVGSPLQLTEGALPTTKSNFLNLYEWSEGRVQLVNVLPDGKQSTVESANIAGDAAAVGSVARAVSSDGRRVAWTWGSPYGVEIAGYKGLYLRDMVAGKTVQLGGLRAVYQTMSSDGSRVFFLEHGDLYVYEAATGTQIDLTATHGAGEANAGVQESVSNVSEDGSYIYFVANGVLGDGAEHGAKSGKCARETQETHVFGQTCNLYLLHDSGGGWGEPKFIATLSSEDETDWFAWLFETNNLAGVTSRASPDGRYLAFMSERSLTGYDNTDAVSGKPDEEVYLYDAVADRLVCASCDPSGARPVGVFATAEAKLAVEPEGQPTWGKVGDPHWLAGSLPGWQVHGSGDTVYQPRFLSDSGGRLRLYFNSPDALVPQDINGLEDVYQYEPPGVGGCRTARAAFSARSGGCVDLISSGTSKQESAFLDASESGDDVFFLSTARLTAADTDTGTDVWDAHVCSASVPCSAAVVSTPPCRSGDSCKAAPAPQPELFGPAPSATFSGAGNVPAASKPLTRAQKLAKALSACHKKKRGRRRKACERKAHKQYGYAVKRSHKASAIGRGGK